MGSACASGIAGERRALDVLHHQIVEADVVQRADVRMIQRGDGAGFPLEALAELLGADLDNYRAVQAVSRAL